MSACQTPRQTAYDVVIVGGAIMGSSTAWFLTQNPDFNGSVLVVEKDPCYEFTSTARTNSCIRQQFSAELNVRISQFTADFVHNLQEVMGDDRIPDLKIQSYGYLYLSDNDAFSATLRANQKIQRALGAGTEVLSPQEILSRYPFYNMDDIQCGSINTVNEGYWDGGTVFDWFRRLAQKQGADYVTNEVVAMTLNAAGTRVQSVTLASGGVITCGAVVNASGPRAVETARMIGADLPIEPRKRFSWIFTAEQPLNMELPLTIDPTGVHMRQDGPQTYLAGATPDHDPAVDYDDFTMDHDIWLDKVWPAIATRIPQFESIRVVTEWAGHYAYNRLDQNAVIGPHDRVENFIFQNGFSGHGLQQSPAMGRAVAEWLTYGEYRALDMTPFGFERIAKGKCFLEQAII